MVALVGLANPGTGRAGDLPSVDLPPPLARVLTDYETAWQAKDPAALSRLFTEDGFVLSPGDTTSERPGRDREALPGPGRPALPAGARP
jgi:hypothetical protein